MESHQKVSRAEKDETRVLEWEECPISGTFMEEMADSSQRFARAILSQQEVDVYLDNVEAGAMEERMARALGMEPGRACTEDGTALTHTVEGMQASIVAGCADLFDDDASAISGPRCRGSSADGGELGVSERTRRSDLGPDVPCVLAAVGEASTTACTARATTCRWTGRPRPCAQGRGRRRGERGGGGGGWGHGAGRGPLPPRSCAAWTCRAAASFCPRRTWATGCTSRTRGRTRRQRRAGAMAFRQR